MNLADLPDTFTDQFGGALGTALLAVAVLSALAAVCIVTHPAGPLHGDDE